MDYLSNIHGLPPEAVPVLWVVAFLLGLIDDHASLVVLAWLLVKVLHG